jgi:hypothetical protein
MMHCIMDKKIILDIIGKNLQEINLLVEALRSSETLDPLLVDIITGKAKILHQELQLLSPSHYIPSPISTIQVKKEAEKEEKIQPETEVPTKLELPAEEPVNFEPIEETIVSSPNEIEDKLVQNEVIINNETEIETLENEPVTEVGNASVSTETDNKPDLVEEKNELKGEVVEVTVEAVKETISVIEVPQTTEIVSVEETVPEPIPSEVDIIIEPEKVVEPIPLIEEQIVQVVSEQVSVTVSSQIIETTKPPTEKKVFGEQFSKEPSLNDRLAANTYHESKIKGKPITSLKGAIGLNDRFLYIRELFASNNELFDKTVDFIDRSDSLVVALEFLEKNFQWTKSEASLKFMDLVKRKFYNI